MNTNLLLLILLFPAIKVGDCRDCMPNRHQGHFYGSRFLYRYNYYNGSYNYLTCQDVFLRKGEPLPIGNWKDNFKYITFKNSIITRLPSGTFVNFENITQLYLNNTKMETISPAAFKGLNKLQQLYLNDNRLTNITKTDLLHLDKLKILDLSKNILFNIEQSSLYGLVSLENLNLSFNRLTQLFSSTFTAFVNLKILDLSYNNLYNIAGHAFINLHALQKLSLSHNYLQHLPKTVFENMTSLHFLDVSLNKLEEFDFYLPEQLGYLNISYNGFNYMKSWKWLKNISVVDLGHNNLSEIIGVGEGVQFLYLKRNKLLYLNSSVFGKAYDLIDLDLSNNDIEKIEENAFHNLTKLEILTLSHNRLEYLDAGTFQNLSYLWRLRLSFNLLSNLEYGTFSGLDNLTVLYLDNNELEYIHENSFYVLGKLRALYLTNNFLTHLNADELIKQLPNLNTVDLVGNNWMCKSLFEVVKTLTDNFIGFYNGSDYYVQNIHGIACKNGIDEENGVALTLKEDEGYLQEQPEEPQHFDELKNSNFFQTFDKRFMNTTFYQFFESNYANTGFSKYLQKGFKKTNFFKYFNKDFFNSSFFKYFDEDFKNSGFYKEFKNGFLKNFNKTEINIEEDIPMAIAQRLVQNDQKEEEQQFVIFANKITVCLFINIALLFIMILFFLLAVFCKQKRPRRLSPEETRMMKFTDASGF